MKKLIGFFLMGLGIGFIVGSLLFPCQKIVTPAVACTVRSTPTPTCTPRATATPTATLTPTSTPVIEPTPTLEPETTPTASPSAIPTETPKQEEHRDQSDGMSDGKGGMPSAPQCLDNAPTLVGANFHVWRKGSDAILQWFPTAGNKVHIYYKQVSSPDWQYSLADQPNNGYAVIHELGGLDITFGLQQSQGCTGGPVIISVIDSATNGWKLFR